MNYALVTGGSSGMGLEYVKQLAEKGYNVIIVALFQNETDAAKELVLKDYPNVDVLSVGMDLSSMDAPLELYKKVKRERPDAFVEVLINNAGILYPKHFKNMTDPQVSRIIMLHNHTTAMLCHYFLPDMLERKRGYILNISSLAAEFQYPFISLYAATKSFTKVFTRALRTELKGSGVVASSIYFGAVSTPLYNLSDNLRKLAINLGVMITPQKASRVALKMLFKGRSGKTPGLINKIALFVAMILPHSLVAMIDKFVTRKWNLD
ncbi:MAG: SDR family NAD(P)-dependent oxidoreductase [Bacteroidales bacterium]|nr:SDR family NAD(P)-dependent oxidoreductase [Bacteroidales bacterium]